MSGFLLNPYIYSQAAAATDPYYEYVSLLLTGDGTNGAQNNTFLDSSTNNFTITRNGNTTQGTFSPYGNLWSNYFSNVSPWGYLALADNDALEPGSSNLTWECWINTTCSTQYATLYSRTPASFATGMWSLMINLASFTAGDVGLYVADYSAGAPLLQTTGVNIRDGVWHHIAVVRNGSAWVLYVDGIARATNTWAGTITNLSTGPRIGNDQFYTRFYDGYISNLRVVKGTALYTSNFTPSTTPLTAVSGTSLLTCQSNRFVDNSSNNFALTVNGNTSVQRFSPFNPTAAYDAATIGGSGYFDGSGDFLKTPSNTAFAMGTGDFTWEGWIYLVPPRPDAFTNMAIFSTKTTSSDTSGAALYVGTNGGPRWLNSSSTAVIPENTWTHIAVSRSGTTTRVYVNGTRRLQPGDSTNYSSSTFSIGANNDGSEIFKGYISNCRVVKGTAIYTDPNNITVPTAPLTAVSGTSLLLNFTNAGIYDSAMLNDLETVGNAQVSTSVKKYGTGSLAFDGTGDYLVAPTNPAYNFGTGDFTLECWIYRNTATTSAMLDARGAPAASPWCWYISTTSGTVSFYNGTNYTTSSNVPTGQWVHLAVTRQSGTLKHWINGTLANTPATVSTALNAGGAMLVGSLYDAGFVLNGYIDDLRITKGYARYTSNFTPPTAAFPTY